MWLVVQQTVGCVFTLILIGSVGYILSRRGWFSPEITILWPRLLMVVALPPYLFSNVISTFNHDELIHMIFGCLLPMGSIAVTFFIMSLLGRLFRVRKSRRGLLAVGGSISNTMFIGLPVNIALFGEAALPYVLLYFFANTTFFWTFGNVRLSKDGARETSPLLSRDTLKRIFSPPLIGFLLGLLLTFLSLRPPEFILAAARYVGSLTTPMAVIFIGITLSAIKFSDIKIDRDMLLLFFGRFILSPLSIVLVMSFFNLPLLMMKVFIIQSALPTNASAVMLAAFYRSDAEFASISNSLTTLFTLFSIPVYMMLIALFIDRVGG